YFVFSEADDGHFPREFGAASLKPGPQIRESVFHCRDRPRSCLLQTFLFPLGFHGSLLLKQETHKNRKRAGRHERHGQKNRHHMSWWRKQIAESHHSPITPELATIQ